MLNAWQNITRHPSYWKYSFDTGTVKHNLIVFDETPAMNLWANKLCACIYQHKPTIVVVLELDNYHFDCSQICTLFLSASVQRGPTLMDKLGRTTGTSTWIICIEITPRAGSVQRIRDSSLSTPRHPTWRRLYGSM